MSGAAGGDIHKLVSFFSFPSVSFLNSERAVRLGKTQHLGVGRGVEGEGTSEEDEEQGEEHESAAQVQQGEFIKRDFQQGGNAPGLDVMTGAITAAQRTKHRVWLQQIAAVTTGVELVQLLERLRITKRWKFSTTSTKIGEIMGAVKRVEVYGGHCRLKGVVSSASFADYKRGVHLRALEEEVSFPVALTTEDVEIILERLAVDGEWETCVALVLQWGTASRPNCLLQVQVRNICITNDAVRVRFVAGKGVAARGEPYTVHTSLGHWGCAVQRWMNNRGSERFLFDQERREGIKKRIRLALRNQNPLYGLRSVRRGAAICMAMKGTQLRVIMHFTGHRSETTCLRYLDWGWHWGEMQSMGTQASTSLWGESQSESSSLDD